jgi:PAS domain-containing protein
MWISNVSVEDIKYFLRHSHLNIVASKADGTILWANEAFCNYIQYTLYELQNIGWKNISQHGSDLEADTKQLSRLTPTSNQYSVQKRYIPKNGKPELGTLHVVAFFKEDKIDYCLTVWEPLKNGTAAAFELAITSTNNMSKAINELSANVATLTTQKEEERFLLSIFRMAQKYPKITIMILVTILGLTGFNNVVLTLQRLNLLPAPVVHIEKDKNANP